jgi:hypothetical protein
MDNHRLDKLLNRYGASDVPRPPANLSQNVWREIRLRQSTPVSSALRYSEFLTWFRGSLLSLVAPALVVALFMSVGLTMLKGQVTPHQRVQQALGLQVFSNQTSPLTRLAQNP